MKYIKIELPDGNTTTPSDKFLLNLHTGRSLTENTTTNTVLIQFDLLITSTDLLGNI